MFANTREICAVMKFSHLGHHAARRRFALRMHQTNKLANSAQPSGKCDLAVVHTIVAQRSIVSPERKKKQTVLSLRDICSAWQLQLWYESAMVVIVHDWQYWRLCGKIPKLNIVFRKCRENVHFLRKPEECLYFLYRSSTVSFDPFTFKNYIHHRFEHTERVHLLICFVGI